jgi:hypothetical protein
LVGDASGIKADRKPVIHSWYHWFRKSGAKIRKSGIYTLSILNELLFGGVQKVDKSKTDKALFRL